MKRLLVVNTGGIGDLHATRARRLTRGLDAECTFVDIDRAASRPRNAARVRAALADGGWDLVFQEGTGLAGGLPLIEAAARNGQPYVVSVGDPIGGFFRTTQGAAMGAAMGVYERLLYRYAAGIVGWTPYLCGAALRLGARRAATVEGAVDLDVFSVYDPAEKRAAKAEYGLDPDHLVFGVVGSLRWTPRQQYAYGLELVRMLPHVRRDDASVLIVGDGDARARMEALVPDAWRARVAFTGRVPEAEVVRAMNAMDVGFITQTLDGLGLFRLTTKLPEYLACGVPVAMSPIPGYYDYAADVGWALPPLHPADDAFHRRLAAWVDGLTREEVAGKAARARAVAEARFSYRVVGARFRRFIASLLDERGEAAA